MMPEVFIAVYADDRDTLIGYIDEIVRGMSVASESFVYLRCALPCGQVREYTRDTVPQADDECHCGTLAEPHFFVKYKRVDPC